MMNKKGFTLVELLAVIVILAILMVAAGAAVMSTLNNARVNTFKNEALSALNIADNMYTEISMNPSDSRKYLKNSDDANYKGMCVSLQGLVSNGYLNKDLGNGETLRGVILIEVPFDGGATKRSIWITNGTYAITGYEQSMISALRYKKDNNKHILKENGTDAKNYWEITDSQVVTNPKAVDAAVQTAMGISGTSYCTDDCGEGESAPENVDLGTEAFHSPTTNQGGTGLQYKGIVCINASID